MGVGGLGFPASMYLAAAGVGFLGLIDDGVVEISNLQRQVVFSSYERGTAKVTSAAERLRALAMSFSQMSLARDPGCATCSRHPSVTTLVNEKGLYWPGE